MQLLTFDLRGPLAHFRRPDTTATHATYPFITRTALRGLLAAVLGMDEFQGHGWAGVQLLAPVRTRTQGLSLLGKAFLSSGRAFNRLTSVELVVGPHYRIYYAGDYADELAARIASRRSTYPTYLGSAFALCVPHWVGLLSAEEAALSPGEALDTPAVVPAHMVDELVVVPGRQYARAGGMLHESLGGRRFRGTLDLIYEVAGRPIRFRPKAGPLEPQVRLMRLASGEVICLW
ncbi:MAG: CRISPR-associated protein Cas5 [Firmicutes bacterium]|nr:CRISPR-associated protein Cas5 [Bacillota bacterium]